MLKAILIWDGHTYDLCPSFDYVDLEWEAMR
jgi:hypothetical protein